MVTTYQKAIESFWKGTCTVIVRMTSVNSETGRNEPSESALYTDEPCRISYSSVSVTADNSEAEVLTQAAKLFLAKSVEIPEGSKIVVTQNGRTEAYVKSGVPAIYSYHQEIALEKFKEWA